MSEGPSADDLEEPAERVDRLEAKVDAQSTQVWWLRAAVAGLLFVALWWYLPEVAVALFAVVALFVVLDRIDRTV